MQLQESLHGLFLPLNTNLLNLFCQMFSIALIYKNVIIFQLFEKNFDIWTGKTLYHKMGFLE